MLVAAGVVAPARLVAPAYKEKAQTTYSEPSLFLVAVARFEQMTSVYTYKYSSA
jgi:hypothetical protein